MNIIQVNQMLSNPTIDAEDLLEACKMLAETGLWKLQDHVSAPSDLINNPDSTLDLVSYLYWCQHQQVTLKINDYRSSQDGALSSSPRMGLFLECYAGKETLALGVKILDTQTLLDGQSYTAPRAFQILDALGNPYLGYSSIELMSPVKLPGYLPKTLTSVDQTPLKYNPDLSHAIYQDIYPAMKLLIPLLLELQKEAREQTEPVEYPSITKEVSTVVKEQVLVESHEVKVINPITNSLTIRPTWWGVEKPEKVLKETVQCIWKLRYLTRICEQSYTRHSLDQPTDLSLNSQYRMIGRTLWKVATKASDVEILIRPRKKLERIVKQE